MGSTSEEVGDGNCTSSGTGTKVVTASTGGVWYELSVGGDDGGVKKCPRTGPSPQHRTTQKLPGGHNSTTLTHWPPPELGG